MIISSNELVALCKEKIKETDVQTVSALTGDGHVVIDVREPLEFEQGRIPGSVNIPRGVLEMQLVNHPAVAGSAEPLQQLAQKDIYLMCRSGARTVLAAQSLQNMGFESVYSVAGGMVAWEKAGLFIEK
jgi:rhodanese-related sulfurtransferase